ncbi:MAG: response regulator transcription factor, partial [Leptothrix sp. (in: b-proteobacteria)]
MPTVPTTTRWRIALADDHAIVRVGFRRLLELEPDLAVVAEYADADAAQADLCGAAPRALDLLTLDLSMPGRSGIDLLRTLRQRRPELAVLVVSMHDSAAMRSQCQAAGASGFVPKSDEPDAVVQAVRRLLAGARGIG